MVPLMLYSYVAPTGAVMLMVPVVVMQVGCTVTDAVAGGAGTGAAFTARFVIAETHPVAMSLTETGYVPGVSPVNKVPAWYVVPLMEYWRVAPNGAVIEMLPVCTAQVGCAETLAVGANGGSLTVTITSFVMGQKPPSVLVAVYVVVRAGEAITVVPLVVFNPAAGLQVNMPLPPDAVRLTLLPLQITGFAGVISRIFTPVFAAMVNVQLSLLNPSIIR